MTRHSAVTVRILGIDPGIATLGFGIIDVVGSSSVHVSHGVIRTLAGSPPEQRLATIASDMQELLETYAPQEVAVEQLFFAKNTTTAMRVAEARGVALASIAASGRSVAEYTPLQVKEAIGGSGSASKREIQEMVRRLLKLTRSPSPDDAADALAIALTHRVRRRIAQLPKRT